MKNFQAYVASFVAYFEGHSAAEPLFIPERDAATEIVKLMLAPTPTIVEFREIARLLKSVDSIQHYDGSGWCGFRGAVLFWLKEHGAEADLLWDLEHGHSGQRHG